MGVFRVRLETNCISLGYAASPQPQLRDFVTKELGYLNARTHETLSSYLMCNTFSVPNNSLFQCIRYNQLLRFNIQVTKLFQVHKIESLHVPCAVTPVRENSLKLETPHKDFCNPEARNYWDRMKKGVPPFY